MPHRPAVAAMDSKQLALAVAHCGFG
jgi:hypothetical protein